MAESDAKIASTKLEDAVVDLKSAALKSSILKRIQEELIAREAEGEGSVYNRSTVSDVFNETYKDSSP